MQTSDLQPWPHGDRRREAALRGLIRVGLAEGVRSGTGYYYRLLRLGPAALATASDGATTSLAARL